MTPAREGIHYHFPTLDGHTFVFVGGLQRSGTTMLYRYLGEHPSVSALEGTPRPANEGQHNQSVYPADEHHSKGGRFAMRAEARLTDDSPLVSDANGRRLYEEWSRYWDTSAPYLMEKSPPNLIRMRFLQALFPDSYFLVIMRHPIAVTMATSRWGKVKPHGLMQHWLRAHELMANDVPHIRRLHILRYEDLVADPDGVLGRAFAFLGLPDHGSGRERSEGLNTDNFMADRTLRTGVNGKYFNLWRTRQRDIVRRVYYDAIERRYQRPVRRFGYDLRRPGELHTPSLDLPGLSASGGRPVVATLHR
jgi:Sulfotransferase family